MLLQSFQITLPKHQSWWANKQYKCCTVKHDLLSWNIERWMNLGTIVTSVLYIFAVMLSTHTYVRCSLCFSIIQFLSSPPLQKDVWERIFQFWFGNFDFIFGAYYLRLYHCWPIACISSQSTNIKDLFPVIEGFYNIFLEKGAVIKNKSISNLHTSVLTSLVCFHQCNIIF